MTVKRINRFEQDRGFVTQSGIKRIVRGRDFVGLDHVLVDHVNPKPTRDAVGTNRNLLVVIHAKAREISVLDREMLYVARAWAEFQEVTAVHAVVFGELAELPWADFGVDFLYLLDDSRLNHYVPEAKVIELERIYADIRPERVLFCESDYGDSDLARRFATAANLSIGTDIYEVTETHVRRTLGNGRFQAKNSLPQVVVLQAGTAADLNLEFVTTPKISTVNLLVDLEPPALESIFSLPSSDIPLVEAEFILSAGNGVKNMDTFHRLAKLLNATVGGSRVVVDDGKLPRELQIGATGQIVKASVYLGVGISGAVQHLQGIKDCGYVIAVNIDETCDLVKRADLAVIQDSEIWMQAMIDQMENAR